MSGHWDYARLCNEIIGDHDTCVQWCEDNGLIPTRSLCSEGHEMFISTGKFYIGQFICSKKHTSGKPIRFTRTRGTVFETRRMPPEKFLILVFCFVNDVSYRDSILESSMDGATTSKETVRECYSFCRELITHHLLEGSKDPSQIGGLGKAVEVVELNLETRKFCLGTFEEGTFIVVMIEHDTKEFRVECWPEKDVTMEDLQTLIKKCVAKGSVIVPHVSRDYSLLSNSGYIIQDTACLRQFEKLTKAGTDKLLEHLFKSDVRRKGLDIFQIIINIIRHTFPVLSKV